MIYPFKSNYHFHTYYCTYNSIIMTGYKTSVSWSLIGVFSETHMEPEL